MGMLALSLESQSQRMKIESREERNLDSGKGL